MAYRVEGRGRAGVFAPLLFSLIFISCMECMGGEKIFTIGAICDVSTNAAVFEGFKRERSELIPVLQMIQ